MRKVILKNSHSHFYKYLKGYDFIFIRSIKHIARKSSRVICHEMIDSTKPLIHVEHVFLPEVSKVSKLTYWLITTYRCLYVLLQSLGIYLHEKKYFLVPLSLSVQEGISLLSIVSYKCSVLRPGRQYMFICYI